MKSIMLKFIFAAVFIVTAFSVSACSSSAEISDNSDEKSKVSSETTAESSTLKSYSTSSTQTKSPVESSNIEKSEQLKSSAVSSEISQVSTVVSDVSEQISVSSEESQDSLSSFIQTLESSAEESSEIRTNSSTLSSPLAENTWGIASKYNTKEQKYINVPVRIVSVIRGDKASQDIKQFMNESSAYNYTQPDSSAEWVIAEYEISLDGFPVADGGTDSTITSFITASDGGYISIGNKKWTTTTINITDGKYYFDGIAKGKIAYQMLTGHSDYVITLGEYNETQAFFKE